MNYYGKGFYSKYYDSYYRDEILAENTQVNSVVSASALNITVDELKIQLGLYGDNSEDTYLESLILSAEEIASNYIGTSISSQNLTDFFSKFAKRLVFSSKYLFSTSSSDIRLRYYDNNRVLQTYASSNYFVDTTGEYPAIVKTSTTDFPMLSQDHMYPIQISYTAGITSSLEAPYIKQAIIMLAMELYNVRYSSSMQMFKPNMSAERILNNLKKVVL